MSEEKLSRPELAQVGVSESEPESKPVQEPGPIDFNTPEGAKKFYDFKTRNQKK